MKICGKNDNKLLEKKDLQENLNEEGNKATILNGRLKGKFVCKNIVNLSKRKLSKSEISLLSKGLKFIPASNTINKAKLKTGLEAFGRMLWLKQFFQNDKTEFDPYNFKPKSTLNYRNKDTAIEIYLSSPKEKLTSNEIPKDKSNKFTRK